MTFRNFNKDTDTLEVGTKIRLAGREGEIMHVFEDTNIGQCYKVEWDADDENILYLQLFDIEIADKPAKPLTIDKRVKEDIDKIFDSNKPWTDIAIEMHDYLNSLEET